MKPRHQRIAGLILAAALAATVAAYYVALTAPAAATHHAKLQMTCSLAHRSTFQECVEAGRSIDGWGKARASSVDSGVFCAQFGGTSYALQFCVAAR